MIDHDAELSAHNQRLRAAASVGPGDHVLDVGCGAGQSTRAAARAAAPGRALGIDLSAQALERARRLSAAEGLDNVSYECGDAQVHPLPTGHYDLAISRFGVMFFSAPVAAFKNICGALRRRARLVLLVWQSRDRNEWASAIDDALSGPVPPPAPARGSDPFSLGDCAATTSMLEHAGFCEIHFADVREPVLYGPDGGAALEFVRGFQSTRKTLARLNPADAERALERLHSTLDDHRTAHAGVVFESRAWLITARRL